MAPLAGEAETSKLSMHNHAAVTDTQGMYPWHLGAPTHASFGSNFLKWEVKIFVLEANILKR